MNHQHSVTQDANLTYHFAVLQAVIEQVRHDHSLLKERVARLGGPKATARLEAGLAAARAAALSQSSSASSTPSASPHSSPAKSSPGSDTGAVSINSPGAVPSSPVAGAAADENEGMAWELLYNLQWQLPTEELEAGWKDATGETSVMKVCCAVLRYVLIVVGQIFVRPPHVQKPASLSAYLVLCYLSF